MNRTLMVAAFAAVVVFAASTAGAVTSDHLQCFKIKDDVANAAYAATLTPTNPTFAAGVGCKILMPAKLLCVDTVKSAVTPAPPGAPDGAPAQTYLCYKTKCPLQAPTWTADDQFGTHNITVLKTGLLCAPVNTIPATTTTTLFTCASAMDCPGMATECQLPTCSMGACGTNFASAGTMVMSQTAGDCKRTVCDGAGSTTVVDDNMDVPNDGNQCTSDQCLMGSPFHPVVPDNTSCSQGGGSICQSGMCVPVCGDGVVSGSETCDDGNASNGDGCSSSCNQETGWTCVGTPSVCGTVCGDGFVRGAEGCDDGGATNGDGCSNFCTVESGFSCVGEPSVCAPL